jgi:tetratricopeptide (TPR) repeat protein
MKSSQRTTRCVLAIVVAGMGMLTAVTADAESQAAARKYAAKANQLAAKNRCKAAVPWFNRAYRALKDPTLLFNRAECLRKLGENNDALQDYELFLVDMPQAPNRASVEAHIAALRAKLKAAATVGSGQDARKEPEQAGSPSAPAPSVAPVEKSPSIEAAKRAEATGETGHSAPANAPSAAASAKEPPPVAPVKSPAASAPVKEPAPAAAKPAEKAAEDPVRRAEKWED